MLFLLYNTFYNNGIKKVSIILYGINDLYITKITENQTFIIKTKNSLSFC